METKTPDTDEQMSSSGKVDLSFCILWAPLHPITCFLPFIGHMGIADSHALACDFQGSYYVRTDGHMMTGPPTRYLKIDVGDLPGGAERWDAAIQEANRVYSQRIHNICCDNVSGLDVQRFLSLNF